MPVPVPVLGSCYSSEAFRGHWSKGRARTRTVFAIEGWPGHGIAVTVAVHSSSPIPPTGLSLSEDWGTTYSLILTEYDPDLRVLGSSYERLKSPKKVGKIDLGIPSYCCYCSSKRDAGRPSIRYCAFYYLLLLVYYLLLCFNTFLLLFNTVYICFTTIYYVVTTKQ